MAAPRFFPRMLDPRRLFRRPPEILLLSGVPATGKSTFGRWLQQERGFLHWDFERQALLTVGKRRLTWSPLLETRPGVRHFVRELGRMCPRVALDWGFPPERLGTIAALQEEGVHTWWFDGDRAAARESFRRRGTVPLEAWHVQMPKIEYHWRRIEEMYGPRMIRTLDANGRYTDPEALAGPILEGAWPRAGRAR